MIARTPEKLGTILIEELQMTSPSTAEIMELVREGADLGVMNGDGVTAAYVCASLNHGDIIGSLAPHGLDVAQANTSGETPLICAAHQWHARALKALIAAGAPLDAQDADGYTALAWAASRGFAEGVRMLLDAGADPSIATHDNRTPAQLARIKGKDDILVILSAGEARQRQKAAVAFLKAQGGDIALPAAVSLRKRKSYTQ